MGLRDEGRTMERQNTLIARFSTAATGPVPDDIERRKEVQEATRKAILQAATIIDIEIDDSREKSLALTHLEEALMWAGKAIFE